MNKQIIHYIKLREQWKDQEGNKRRAVSEILSGFLNFMISAAYWVVEKYFLQKEMERMYQQNPNFKYFFYVSVAIGIWGLINCLWGVFNYFNTKGKAESLKLQVEELEKELN